MDIVTNFELKGMLSKIYGWQIAQDEQGYLSLKFLIENLLKSSDIVFNHPFNDDTATICRTNVLIRSGNPRNILFFSDEKFQNRWYLIQGYNFIDVIIVDDKAYCFLAESLCQSSINAFNKMFLQIPNNSKFFENNGEFVGFIINHQRPYHYFYDQLVSLFEFENKLNENNKKIFLGPDCFYKPTFFKTYPYKKTDNNFVLFPTVLGIFKKRLEVYKHTAKKMENAIFESKDLCLTKIDYNKFNFVIWLGIAGEKRSWLEQIDGYKNILKELSNYFDNILVLIDGMSANAGLEINDKENKKLAELIMEGLSVNIKILSLAGKDYHTKICYCHNVDFFISDAGATCIIPRYFCKKPGVIHFSNNPIIFTVEENEQVRMLDPKFIKNSNNGITRRDVTSYHIQWQHIFNLSSNMINDIKNINIKLLKITSTTENLEINKKQNIKQFKDSVYNNIIIGEVSKRFINLMQIVKNFIKRKK